MVLTNVLFQFRDFRIESVLLFGVKQEGQPLPKADPKPVKTVFALCRRFFRRLDDGGRIAGKHQPGFIQRHRRGEQVARFADATARRRF